MYFALNIQSEFSCNWGGYVNTQQLSCGLFIRHFRRVFM